AGPGAAPAPTGRQAVAERAVAAAADDPAVAGAPAGRAGAGARQPEAAVRLALAAEQRPVHAGGVEPARQIAGPDQRPEAIARHLRRAEDPGLAGIPDRLLARQLRRGLVL